MTRNELLTAIKIFRDQGYSLQIKLNASNEALRIEYNRLQLAWNSHNIDAVATLEPDEELPEASIVPASKSDEATIEYLEMAGCDIDDFEAIADARQFLDENAPWTIETSSLAEQFVNEIKAEDTYWQSWNAAYFRAMDALKTPALVPAPIPTHKQINHGEFGIALCLMIVECWRVVATLLVPLIAQTFNVVRQTAITSTLVMKGFKHAALLAKKSLQTA
jgi:hypothetical protein